MTKGRVVERSQTGALHTTPPGDKAAGPRGPSAPGSGDHLKEKACAEAGSARMSLLILVSIFLSAAFVMFLVYKNFPQLSEEERVNMKVPRDMDDAKALGKVLSKYKDTFYVQCSGLGASFCYMLSYLVGRPVVYKYLTEKAVKWSQQNAVSGSLKNLYQPTLLMHFISVAPPSFVAIKAGTTLYQLTTAGEAVSWNSLAFENLKAFKI
eukprot:bmy_04487T0